MKRNAPTFVVLSCLMLSACQPSSQEVASPDYSSALTGQFNATYLITDPSTGQSFTGGTRPSAFVQLKRKTNNTLQIDVALRDGSIQFQDQFEAKVIPADVSNDGLSLPGLRSRYRLSYVNLNQKGESASELNVYRDGKIRGGIGYVNSSGQTVSLAFIE